MHPRTIQWMHILILPNGQKTSMGSVVVGYWYAREVIYINRFEKGGRNHDKTNKYLHVKKNH